MKKKKRAEKHRKHSFSGLSQQKTSEKGFYAVGRQPKINRFSKIIQEGVENKIHPLGQQTRQQPSYSQLIHTDLLLSPSPESGAELNE